MYQVHVPARVDPATPAPLMFALHGGGGSMDYQADDAHYGHITKSDREAFVVVFPNGFSRLASGKFATWNAGNCCGGARDQNVDDVGFIRRIVANVTRQMNIDRNRIYATGMSNGGLMAYRLACEMSDVFKAIAAVAGTDNTRSCKPKKPVSILHMHATNDTHVVYTGGAGPKTRDKSMVTDFTSVAETVSKWVRLNGCTATPRRILEKAGAYCEVYAPCQGNAEVQLCVTESGGHSWPPSPWRLRSPSRKQPRQSCRAKTRRRWCKRFARSRGESKSAFDEIQGSALGGGPFSSTTLPSGSGT